MHFLNILCVAIIARCVNLFITQQGCIVFFSSPSENMGLFPFRFVSIKTGYRFPAGHIAGSLGGIGIDRVASAGSVSVVRVERRPAALPGYSRLRNCNDGLQSFVSTNRGSVVLLCAESYFRSLNVGRKAKKRNFKHVVFWYVSHSDMDVHLMLAQTAPYVCNWKHSTQKTKHFITLEFYVTWSRALDSVRCFLHVKKTKHLIA